MVNKFYQVLKKRRKSGLVKIEERDIVKSNRWNESDDNGSVLDDIIRTDISQWEWLTEMLVMISNTSDSDWLP